MGGKINVGVESEEKRKERRWRDEIIGLDVARRMLKREKRILVGLDKFFWIINISASFFA